MSLTSPATRSTSWRLRLGERRILLLAGDFLMAAVSLGLGMYYWFSGQAIDDLVAFLQQRLEAWFFLLPFLWLILLVELYDPHRAADARKTVRGVVIAALIGLGIYMVVFFFSDPGSLPRRGVAGFVASASVLTLAWRLVYLRVFTAPRFMRRVLLVGAGATGQAMLQVINDLWPQPFFLVGIVDDDREKIGREILGRKVLGDSEKLLSLIAQENVSDLIVAITGKMQSSMFQALLDAQERGVEITRMPVAYEELLGRVPVQHLEADWILRYFVDEARTGNFYGLSKRLLDILGGLVGVLIFIFIAPVIAFFILAESGRPVLFQQTRSGKGGRPYTIMKFRTMQTDAEKNGAQLAKEDDERATSLGRFLRKTRLDEWPQFINVLRGEMSLVGPRPERPELMEHFQQQIPFYRGRLLDKPGITGWAQVNLGYAASLEEMVDKLEYDLYYIKHRNILLDFVIILRTVGTVIGLRGQ
jgi:exopolysaccharide biosynthesis polyprenyl glycosylphosphotransferase